MGIPTPIPSVLQGLPVPVQPTEWGSIADIGATTIALLALFRPEIEAVVNRFQPTKLEFHLDSENIAVGFSDRGPTISLYGTIIAINRGLYIKRISMRLKRLRDGATHVFNWALFFPTTSSDESELPHVIRLEKGECVRFNILFSDSQTQTDMREHISKIQHHWYSLQTEKTVDGDASKDSLSSVYRDYTSSPLFTSSLLELDRVYYWTPGEYEISLDVDSTVSSVKGEFSWKFEVNQSDSGYLRANSKLMLDKACYMSDSTYNVIYPMAKKM